MAERRVRRVLIRYQRDFPHPLSACYDWLTDYQDDDPSLTSHIIKARPVVTRTKEKVVLDGTLEVLGNRIKGRAEVHLFPPDYYEAHFSTGTVYRYRLTPVAGGTRLSIDYDIATRRLSTWLRLQAGRPLVRREIHKMWDDFAKSMAKDMAQVKTAPA